MIIRFINILIKGGLGPLNIPLLADPNLKISSDYGVLLPAGLALRGTFIIDKNGILKHIGINDLPVGRSYLYFMIFI